MGVAASIQWVLSMRGAGAPALASRDRIEDVKCLGARDLVDQDFRDLAREVYCVLGMPIDAVDMAATLRKINEASLERMPFLISTANLNFLANSLADPEFRESLLLSDLCTADGIPIVWLDRLLGLPFKQRIAGADILDHLRTQTSPRKLRSFFFGGADGIAEAACRMLNADKSGLTCVGTLNPGFGTISDMSSDAIIGAINASNADFLVVALGAGKGQAWLLRNHYRLRVPVRAHLGAAINFQAGQVKRAPVAIRKMGLEWLWRIKEEPNLWVRYWRDGCTLLRLVSSHVVPLACQAHLRRWRRPTRKLYVDVCPQENGVVLKVFGDAVTQFLSHATDRFQHALALSKPLIVDLSAVRDIDQRFFGLILTLRKCLHRRGGTLLFFGVSARVRKLFQLNGLEFLLDGG